MLRSLQTGAAAIVYKVRAARRRVARQRWLRVIILVAMLVAAVSSAWASSHSTLEWILPLVGWTLPVGHLLYELAVAVSIACIIGLFVESYVVSQIVHSVLEEVEPQLRGHDPLVLEELQYIRGRDWVRMNYHLTVRIVPTDEEDAPPARPYKAYADCEYEVLNYSGQQLKFKHKVNLTQCTPPEVATITEVGAWGRDLVGGPYEREFEGRGKQRRQAYEKTVYLRNPQEQPDNHFRHSYHARAERDDVWSWTFGHPTVNAAIEIQVPDDLDLEVSFAHRCFEEQERNGNRWWLNKFFVPGTGIMVHWFPKASADATGASKKMDRRQEPDDGEKADAPKARDLPRKA